MNGASSTRILRLITREYLLLIGVAILIATPVTWMLMERWLQGFPYRTPVHAWVFILTALFSLFLTIAAVSIQTLRAAARNPSESLRYE